MELKRINYSHNWNNKLLCTVFTTIRLRNDNKYKCGETYEVWCKGRKLYNVIIVEIIHFKLHQLKSHVAYIDTGYNLEQTREVIYTMYKNKSIDFNTQDFSLIIQQRVKAQEQQSKLF